MSPRTVATVALAAALLVASGGGAAAQQPAAGEGDAASPPGPQELEALWSGGVVFGAFLDDARRRRETWLANADRAAVPAPLLERLMEVDGAWRILAVAEDWCGDSVHTLPYVAALAEAAPNVDLRVVRSGPGRRVMEAHRTPDGRASTPTFVLLDDAGSDRGCLVERPPGLQAWFLAARDSLPEAELYERKYAWYEEDAGEATLEEIVAVLEAASRGGERCTARDAGAGSGGVR